MNLNIPILPTLTNSIKSDIFLQQNLLNNKCMKSLLKITKAGKVTLELFRQRQYMNNAGNNPLKLNQVLIKVIRIHAVQHKRQMIIKLIKNKSRCQFLFPVDNIIEMKEIYSKYLQFSPTIHNLTGVILVLEHRKF